MKHQMVLVRAASIDQLPRKPDGSIDEDKIPEADKVGESGELDPHSTKKVTFTMQAGTYIMFCNIAAPAASPVSHFNKGMHTQFTLNT